MNKHLSPKKPEEDNPKFSESRAEARTQTLFWIGLNSGPFLDQIGQGHESKVESKVCLLKDSNIKINFLKF